MRKLSLFSGILGDDLASEWTGIETVCCVEIDPFCQAVIKKHYPDMPIIGDIHDVTKAKLKEVSGCEWVDIIAGGFPCQDISGANTFQPRGIDGERSGLWREFKRLVFELRPEYVVVENVSALLFRGLSRVLGDLSEMGYDAEWKVIPAAAVGAPHLRERTFILSYPRGKFGFNQCLLSENGGTSDAWDKDKEKWSINREFLEVGTEDISRLDIEWAKRNCNPEFLRVSHGIPRQLDRLRSLGNSLVPQQVYQIYKAIAEVDRILSSGEKI